MLNKKTSLFECSFELQEAPAEEDKPGLYRRLMNFVNAVKEADEEPKEEEPPPAKLPEGEQEHVISILIPSLKFLCTESDKKTFSSVISETEEQNA